MKKESELLLIVTVILACTGIVMVYSSSSCYAYDKFNDSAYFFKRHIAHFIIGLLCAAFVSRIDYRKFKNYSRILLGAAILSLMAALVPGIGHEAGGAKRWIKLGFIGFQPSEFTSLFLIIYLADILERKQECIRDFFHGFMPPLAVSGFLVLLIIIQPDLGSAVAIMAVSVVMIFAAGENMAYLIPFALFSAGIFSRQFYE